MYLYRVTEALDLPRGYEFLDRELAEICPEPEKPPGTRVVDKLVKVYQKDGTERWMLLHIEVQGQNKGVFASRMFQYYYRLSDRYRHPVAAVAIFTGANGKTLPQSFETQCLWTKVRYDYKTLFVGDYEADELSESKNSFAAILSIAKEIMLRRKKIDNEDKELLEHKLMMVRLIKERTPDWGAKKANAILIFLNNYVSFQKPETNRIFMEQTDVIMEKKNTMGILEQLAEIKAAEALEEGKELGRLEAKEETIRILLKATDFPPEKIADLVGVPLSLVQKIQNT